MLTLSGETHIATRLQHLIDISPTNIVTPLNHDSARHLGLDDLLDGHPVNPRFQYDAAYLTEIANRRAQIAEDGYYLLGHLDLSGSTSDALLGDFVKQLLQARLQTADQLCQLAQAIVDQDDAAAGLCATRLFGTPSQNAIHMATVAQVREGTRSIPEQEYSPHFYKAQQAVDHCNQVIQRYGFSNCSAELSPTATTISVRDGKIRVPSDYLPKSVELARLVGHEIEARFRCHANTTALIQRAIDKTSPLMGLAPWLAKSVDENILEAVAKISDISVTAAFTGNGSSQWPHPWYLLGASRALRFKLNFDETIHWLYDQFRGFGKSRRTAANAAWTITYRLYRGITDPLSCNYVFTKDIAHFNGYYRLRSIQAENPKLYLLALDYGSLSENELSCLSTIQHHVLASNYDDSCASGNATPASCAIFRARYPSLRLAVDKDTLPR